MNDVFGFKKGQPVTWYNKDLTKSNQYCPYCGACVGIGSQVASDKEHLIARNFVPKGSLDAGGFNFIFRACQTCNSQKSNVERHISSVTLFNSPGRSSDEDVDALALHKASHDYHPDKKGVLVKDASDHHSIEFGGGGVQVKFSLVGPPQLNPDAVCLLACLHIQGIFSMITSEDPREREKTKILPADKVLYFGHYTHLDWGNPHLMEIARRSANWENYANIVTANGYFKLLVKACNSGTKEWFWALEWNKFLRVVGVICSPSVEPELFSDLPELNWRPSPDGNCRSRREVPLPEEEDILFPSVEIEEELMKS
ncbi:MAG TPA: hypothetical protein VIA62_25865 [Thermoanaerobaculia bacterium]|jgi:hypothetical protein|nr:hypothetical protein [Thermoanaerobaculia bacterium]